MEYQVSVIEIIDDSSGTCNTNSSMLRSILCDSNHAYILLKGTITIEPIPPQAANTNSNNKEVIFKNCAPFTDCISEINNT